VVSELQKLNKSLLDFKEVIDNSKVVEQVKDNTEFSKAFSDLTEKLQDVSEKISGLDFSKLPTPQVIIPKKLEISNLPDKQKIDWENKPKEPLLDIVAPMKMLFKSLQGLLKPFIDRIEEFIIKTLDYIRQPDRIVATKNSYTEFYGNRQVKYTIRGDGDRREVIRESS